MLLWQLVSSCRQDVSGKAVHRETSLGLLWQLADLAREGSERQVHGVGKWACCDKKLMVPASADRAQSRWAGG